MKNPLIEKILFLKVKNKDKEAFGKFYDLYISRIYRFIFFKVNSVHDAQDLASEVFLKVWQYVREDKEIKNLNAFTYMVARNSVIDFYRQKSKKGDREELIEENCIPRVIDEDNDLAEKHNLSIDIASVLAGLDNLKDEYKEIVVLRYLDELSIEEISQVLGKSKGAIRILTYRALNALKDCLKKNESQRSNQTT
ncbi:MAG: RNA polymerase sigma factor [Candidatus Buchananbacteria bacterium]